MELWCPFRRYVSPLAVLRRKPPLMPSTQPSIVLGCVVSCGDANAVSDSKRNKDNRIHPRMIHSLDSLRLYRRCPFSLKLQVLVEELHRHVIGFARLRHVGIVEETMEQPIPQMQFGLDSQLRELVMSVNPRTVVDGVRARSTG